VKKRRVTLNLDEDVVEALKQMDSRSLSAAANTALRETVEAELHRKALLEWLEELYEEHGRPSPEDYAAADAVLDEAFRGARPQAPGCQGAA
jgi:post-segregation antitoxin (ccd killing protein)